MIDYKAILDRYQAPVPRYTSYPTAPQFKAGEGAALFEEALKTLSTDEGVSAYIHIPFCDRLCWFCGCHTKHTLKYAPVQKYMKAVVEELRLFAQKLAFRPHLKHLHLGGGSPSLLKRDDLIVLREALDSAFTINDTTEISVEIDPSDVMEETIAALVEFGLNRASIGVQDFHEDVQKAINRPQTYEITRDVVQQLRAAGVSSVNIDALYGLPLQTHERLMQTLEQCLSLAPDRMALFGYAHVPWLKKHQRMINDDDLAGTLERFEHAQSASAILQGAGFQAIGIDHFARKSDELAKAANAGVLRRNFQGYTTDAAQTMFGFGGSSIGQCADGFIQNTVATGQYEAEVAAGKMPKDKGIRFTDQDRLHGSIIEHLMCNFTVDFADLTEHAADQVAQCLHDAQVFAASDGFGLSLMEGTRLSIPEAARPFARIVASQFDAYFEPEGFQYSKAV